MRRIWAGSQQSRLRHLSGLPEPPDAGRSLMIRGDVFTILADKTSYLGVCSMPQTDFVQRRVGGWMGNSPAKLVQNRRDKVGRASFTCSEYQVGVRARFRPLQHQASNILVASPKVKVLDSCNFDRASQVVLRNACTMSSKNRTRGDRKCCASLIIEVVDRLTKLCPDFAKFVVTRLQLFVENRLGLVVPLVPVFRERLRTLTHSGQKDGVRTRH